MAKKKPDPAAVAQRKQERVAFVQANPNLAPEQARQQFYVKTRTEELSAAGKSVDKQALRDKFQSGQVSREGFYTPGDIARFNTSGSNNGGSLADSKADTVTSPTSLTVPSGVKTPNTSYMAPKTTTALGLEVAPTTTVPSSPTTTVPSSSTTIPVTDTPPKTVLKTGNISGPNVRMGMKQAQPTKTPKVTGKTLDQVTKDMGITWKPNTVDLPVPDSIIGIAHGDDSTDLWSYGTSGRGDSALSAYSKQKGKNRKEFGNTSGLIAENLITGAAAVAGGAVGSVVPGVGTTVGAVVGSAIGTGLGNFAYNMFDPIDTSESSGEAGKRAAIYGAIDLVGGTVISGAAKVVAPRVIPTLSKAFNKVVGGKTITDDALMAADDVAGTMDYSQWSRDINVPGTATPKPPATPKVVDPIARQQAADAALLKPKAPSTPKVPKTPKADKISMSNLPKDAPYVDVLKSKATRWNAAADAELAEQARQAVRLDSPIALPGKTALPDTVEPIFPNQRLALPRGDAFQTPAPVVETPKPLTSAERMENAAAVVARSSKTKPPVAQAVDPNPSLHATKQAELQAAVPETNTIEVVTPTVKPPRASTRKPKVKTTPVAETPKPIIETSSGATAPRDFAAEYRVKTAAEDFEYDQGLTEWVNNNPKESDDILLDVFHGGSSGGKTDLNNLSGISGQRVSRSDLFGGNRFGHGSRSPMDRGMFIEDVGAQPVGNLNPTPAPAANMREYKGIKYTVDPNNPMIGIQEGTGVQFTLRRTKSGKPGTPHTSGVDVATGLPKLRTPRTKFADDVERKAAEKTAEKARSAKTSVERAEGAVTTEQIVKAAQEKADAGATKTLGEFPMTPTRRGRMLAQYERDVASGKIQADEPFTYSSRAVTKDPVIGEGSMPRKPVTSLGTTKAPTKTMDIEMFKKLSDDMFNRSNAQLSDLADSRVANTQYDDIVAEYGKDAVDRIIKSVRFRQQVADKKLLAGELDDVMGTTKRAKWQKRNDVADARSYSDWFSSREAQQMRVDNPALFSEIVNKPENVAKRALITKTTNSDVASTMPRSFRQSRVDINDSLAQQRTALQGARSEEDVALGLNADKPTVAQVDAEFTDAGNADDFAIPFGQNDFEGKIAWADSQPSQPIRDTPWERSYSAKKTASADAAETIANGSDDEVLALAKKYEIPVSGETPADVARLRSELARRQDRSASGPGRTSERSVRSDGVPPPVKPLQSDLVSQGLSKEQIKATYDAHRKAYQDWADQAVMEENPFAGQFRFAEAPKPRAKAVPVNRTTVHPDGTPKPTSTELPLKLNEVELRAKIGKDGYTKADMDAEIAANTKLRAEVSVKRQQEAAAITKWNNEAVTTTTPKKPHWTEAADAKDDAWGMANRELLATDPEKWHAIRQGVEERRIAQHLADISTPEGEAARAGAAAENARMAAHRAELEMPAIKPDTNVLQQQDWVAEVSRRFFGSTNAPAPTIPVARTPRSAMPEVSVADWETSVNQRFNNPSGNTPRLRRPGAPNRPFEAGEDTLGDLSMIPGDEHVLIKDARALGMDMTGPINDWTVQAARVNAQKGTSALSGYVDDVSASVQQLKAELGTLAGKLNSAKTQAQQRKITGQMRNIQDEINLQETSRISGRDKDNYEYDLGLD